MDITYLRFANSVLEPVWNREHVSHVQMTIAEDFGVDDRGRFYDAVGAMRDVIQNHALQVLALVAMGPPTGNHHDSIRDKKLELFKAMRTADPKRYVRGQYDGFRDVKDVAPDSTTETFAAVELEIDNWRWSGVPFFIRAGKSLPVKASEVSVVFKRPPQLGVGAGQAAGPEPDDGADRARRPAPACASSPRRRARRPSSRPTSRSSSRRSRARSPSPTSACSATRSPAAPALHPPGHGRGDLADRAAAARRAGARAPLRARDLGTEGGGQADPRHLPVVGALAAGLTRPFERNPGRRARLWHP